MSNRNVAATWRAALGAGLVLAALTLVPFSPGSVRAQGEPPIVVTQSEPAVMITGTATQISIFGENFTAQTTVRLTGFGLLTTTFINANALTAAVPASVPPGVYSIEVSDPVRGAATSPINLTVQAIPPTAAPPLPPPTLAPTREPTATLPPPTPLPGEPSLVIRSYSASPPVATPGSTIVVTLEIVNQGNRAAQAITVEIGSGGNFVAAAGQGTVLLPDLAPNATAVTNLAVVPKGDANTGANQVAIKFSYRDFQGTNYTRDSAVTVEVSAEAEVPQITVTRASTEPAPGEPGEPLVLRLEVTNSGNTNAEQVILRVKTAADSVLLPGEQGDSFPIGDLPPGGTVNLELPMILNAQAKPGPQLQALSIGYLLNDEAKEVTTGVTIEVGEVRSAPLFLLESYTTDPGTLVAGGRFTLALVIVNAGTTPAEELTLTYGAGATGADSAPTPDPTSQPTPSAASVGALFAPTDAGAVEFLDRIDGGGGRVELARDFIVSGTVSSGIYDFPITLRYRRPDGSSASETLRASLVVINPPRLRIALATPLPEQLPVGEPLLVSLRVINIGRKDVALTLSELETENADVIDGQEVFIGTLRPGEDRILDSTIQVSESGEVVLNYTLNYLDDFNQDQTITQRFTAEAALVEPVEEFPLEPSPDATPPPPAERDWFARLVLALFGLGS